LDRLPIATAIQLMLSEEAKVPRILAQWEAELAAAVKLVSAAFRKGGRLFYVGAGTSDRLGVLDASECPPTFRTVPDLVQGIIAGGETALRRSVEGAEDDDAAGARAIRERKISQRDVVMGIAASGTTPFVWGALAEAKHRRATTILLCFNPYLKIPRPLRPQLVMTPDLGPEVLTGSTRLKAGTATKLVLNTLTTLAMVQLGKVSSNLMVDLTPTNTKLRARAGARQIRVRAENHHAGEEGGAHASRDRGCSQGQDVLVFEEDGALFGGLQGEAAMARVIHDAQIELVMGVFWV
jgi:N-acetylmuramic acid 6-phosphate etherase